MIKVTIDGIGSRNMAQFLSKHLTDNKSKVMIRTKSDNFSVQDIRKLGYDVSITIKGDI